MSTIKVKAIRTNCCNGEERVVDAAIERHYHTCNLNSWWIAIIEGGVTGYESMAEDRVESMVSGWSACAGTKNSWDKLFISGEEMMKVAEWIKQQRQKEQTHNPTIGGGYKPIQQEEQANPPTLLDQ